MKPPNSYKEVQKLTRCLAAFNRIISKSGERNLPFFKNLRRMSKGKFHWDEECNKTFEELKRYLGSPKLLSRPEHGERLQIYLAISDVAQVGSSSAPEEDPKRRGHSILLEKHPHAFGMPKKYWCQIMVLNLKDKCWWISMKGITADQALDSQDLPVTTTPVPSSGPRREQFSHTKQNRTISTRLVQIVESPIVIRNLVIENPDDICGPVILADYHLSLLSEMGSPFTCFKVLTSSK
ncbi:hypothetical protein LIER_13284 [Lithospermum erythrorhizon]|uniref:Uncharacterized protein n=1 Tax=Lithospermum erythrorhizon TaxID=34254 RepID=A0AAV3PWE2_LITER